MECSVQEIELYVPIHNLPPLEKDRKNDQVWVPRTLSEKEKENRIFILTSLLSSQRNNSFLENIITSDKNAFFIIMFKVKSNGLTRMNLCSLPQKRSCIEKKLCCVYGGIIVVVFIFSCFFKSQLQQQQRVHKNLLRKQPALVSRRNVVLFLDNSRSHSAKITEGKILDLSWFIPPHPSYSPDLAPSDFHFFLLLDKMFWMTNNFSKRSSQNVSGNVLELGNVLEFYWGINKLLDKWQEGIQNNGEYTIDWN